MSNHLIEVKNVYKIYNPGENEVRALDGISVTIDHGEFVAIVGHSGSGKSTFMNMLGCLDTPTSGDYYLDGVNVAGMTDDELSDIRNKQIGFIFQGFNLIPSLTAQENVELPLVYRGMPAEQRRQLAEEALTRVGMEHRMNHRPSELSGGQQQRVAIARAIAARPPIIMADEPTGNLDTRSGEEVMKILHELNEEGRTIVLITHDNDIGPSGHPGHPDHRWQGGIRYPGKRTAEARCIKAPRRGKKSPALFSREQTGSFGLTGSFPLCYDKEKSSEWMPPGRRNDNAASGWSVADVQPGASHRRTGADRPWLYRPVEVHQAHLTPHTQQKPRMTGAFLFLWPVFGMGQPATVLCPHSPFQAGETARAGRR